MNERLKAMQSKLLAEAYEKQQGMDWVMEKFAELIVKECADIANKQFTAVTGVDDRDCLTAAEMKQHFGVE